MPTKPASPPRCPLLSTMRSRDSQPSHGCLSSGTVLLSGEDGEENQASFQWDGEVIDAGPQVQCIELKGSGDHAQTALQQLVETLGLSADRLLIEHVHTGERSNGGSYLAPQPPRS